MSGVTNIKVKLMDCLWAERPHVAWKASKSLCGPHWGIYMNGGGGMVSLCGVWPQWRLQGGPFGLEGHYCSQPVLGGPSEEPEPDGAESARGMLGLADQELTQPLCHGVGSTSQTGEPCPTGQSSTRAPQAREATSVTTGLGNLPQILLRGRLGEEDRVGRNCEHFLGKDCFKPDKKLLK